MKMISVIKEEKILINSLYGAKLDDIKMRGFLSEGSILAICEKGEAKNLRGRFIHACYAIFEKIEESVFEVVKHRSAHLRTISIEDLEKTIDQYATVIFVIDKETIIDQRSSDLIKMSPESPIREFYRKKRGTIIGKKFGL